MLFVAMDVCLTCCELREIESETMKKRVGLLSLDDWGLIETSTTDLLSNTGLLICTPLGAGMIRF